MRIREESRVVVEIRNPKSAFRNRRARPLATAGGSDKDTQLRFALSSLRFALCRLRVILTPNNS
jgi:hypothetical protein